VRETILPALERGAWVISDRFTDSSYAYQGGGRGLDLGFIAELEQRVVGIQPGLTLLLDLGVAQGRERTRGRDLAFGGNGPDRIERERDDFFEHVRRAFLARARAEPERVRVVDASQPAKDVAADAVAILRMYIARTASEPA
jgi:dTMP kinase